MKDFADLSEFKIEVLTDKIQVEGDTKYVWDINPDYRIKVGKDNFFEYIFIYKSYLQFFYFFSLN